MNSEKKVIREKSQYFLIEMFRLLNNLTRFSSIREKIRAERETRLGKTVSQSVLPTKSIQQIQKIRNIGIIAHIDAGKTTTTQRMLYYAGALPSPGDIDEGTTTMDYMKQERQRGITIRSAAITFNWRKCQVNLIDTPGHVDFSGEVARSLKVLDGAITILDGVKGVQAQTIKVWQQAKKRGIPRICYINKMDRIGASILQAAQSIQQRLKVQPLIMQQPIGQADLFRGVYDLVTMQQVNFIGKYGQMLQKSRITKQHPKYKQLLAQRMKLIEQIGNYNQDIAELYLAEKEISVMKLKQAIKTIMLTQNQHNLCPIYMGTSFKNKGVQPVMDAIIDYLPSPNQRPPIHDAEEKDYLRKPLKTEPLTGYVFKILYDLEMGPLAYTRIYSGQMKKNTNLLNSSTGTPEKIGHIYRVRANQYVSVNHIHTGDIVAISGLRDTKAGQTLIQYGAKKFCLDPLELPSAIFTVPFEVQSNKYLNAFKQAIQKATVQDDSLKYEFQPQTGQYLLSGLGELHLQILRDKLIQQRIPVKMGNLKINYKQTVGTAVRDKLKIRKELKPGVFEQFEVQIEVVPLRTENQQIEKKNNITFMFERIPEFDENWREFLRRKLALSHSKKASMQGEDQTQQNFGKISKKSIRNPTPVQPIQQQVDQDDDIDQNDNDDQQVQVQTARDEQNDQPLYHISTLPFQTLYELYETCKVSLMYGKRNYPMMGVEIRIHNGIYTKSTFTKSILNRTTTELLRKLINSSSVLLEPMMEFTLSGEEQMIDHALKDVLHKRGAVDVQQQNMITGKIPASEVRGWIKELRAMGLEVEMKFSDYEQVTGVDPNKLLQNN